MKTRWNQRKFAFQSCYPSSNQLVGETPMRYLTGWRMQKARELLRETNLPLAAVPHQVGYNSQAAFIRAFHREFVSSQYFVGRHLPGRF